MNPDTLHEDGLPDWEVIAKSNPEDGLYHPSIMRAAHMITIQRKTMSHATALIREQKKLIEEYRAILSAHGIS